MTRRALRGFHGSKRRLRRIRMRDEWPKGLTVVVAIFLFVLLVGLPYLIRHPPTGHEHHAGLRSGDAIRR